MGDAQAARRCAPDERTQAGGSRSTLPTPPPPHRSPPGTVAINVSGQRFLACAASLQRVAGARLATLTTADPEYDEASGEYFFARSAAAFACVLDYYHTGRLHRPSGLCADALSGELLFWGLELNADSAAPLNRCPRCFADDGGGSQSVDDRRLDAALASFDSRYTPPSPCSEADFVRYQLWYMVTESALVTKPFRHVAQAWSFGYSFFSVLLFVVVSLSTVKSLQVRVDIAPGGDSNGTIQLRPQALDGYSKLELPYVSRPETWIGLLFVCCCVYFGAEFSIRTALCPNRRILARSPCTYLDLVLLGTALGVVSLIVLNKQHELPALYWTLKVCQMARVVRYATYAAQFRGVKVLLLTIRFSFKEVLTLWCLVLLNAMIFATLSYLTDIYFEGGVTDMLTGLWWATVTMTTVGYGDVVPNTPSAKVIGGLCALSGLVIVALPIAIIGQNYIRVWERAVAHDIKFAESVLGHHQ